MTKYLSGWGQIISAAKAQSGQRAYISLPDTISLVKYEY